MEVKLLLSSDRLFPLTGWRVGGDILQFWDANGGLPIFGLPLASAGATAGTESVPSPRNSSSANVSSCIPNLPHPITSRWASWAMNCCSVPVVIGAAKVTVSNYPANAAPSLKPAAPSAVQFLDYWQSHGLASVMAPASDRGSLALFGYPLTAPQLETNSSGDHVLTQWFERARFELHPNLTQPVLLGRLGAEWSGQTNLDLPLLDAAATPASRRSKATPLRSSSRRPCSLLHVAHLPVSICPL